MLEFSAAIHVDPDGYHWVDPIEANFGPLSPMHSLSIFLRAKRHAAFKEEAGNYLAFQTPLPHTYDPFVTEPALFQIFARLEPTEESILQFANKYGDVAQLESLNTDGGMCLKDWVMGIMSMKKSVDLLIQFTDDSARPQKPSEYALKRLNRELFRAPVHLEARWESKSIRMRAVVTNLLDVMSLQFASAIEGRKKYRDCEFCGKPFELSPQVNRADKVYCSANCRVKAYQRRKKQVIELRNQGESLRAIVKKSGSDMETVKKWITDSQAKEKSSDEKAPWQR